MQPSPTLDKKLHQQLPIEDDEKILAVFKHHWFIYASTWIVTVLLVIAIMGVAAVIASIGDFETYRAMILAGASILSLFILISGMIPAYLKSQEQLVLTEESLLQVLRPTLFASKVSQLSLQHIADVSVTQGMLGTTLGYGDVMVETPGEQHENYQFLMMPHPRDATQLITEAHENFDAALQGGRLETTLGEKPAPAAPTIDPQEFQEFLEFQQMKRQQAGVAEPQAPAQTPTPEQEKPAEPDEPGSFQG